jgi:hypothetical protein
VGDPNRELYESGYYCFKSSLGVPNRELYELLFESSLGIPNRELYELGCIRGGITLQAPARETQIESSTNHYCILFEAKNKRLYELLLLEFFEVKS